MARLILIDNSVASEVQMGQELTIGRAYSNLLRLEGEEISRVHCIIYRRGDDHVLRDLDSKNGVLLNGEKVANKVVEPGDVVQVGQYVMLFDPPDDAALEEFLEAHGAVFAQKGDSVPLPPSVSPRSPVSPPPPAAYVPDDNTSDHDVTLHTFRSDTHQPITFSTAEVEGMADTQFARQNAQFVSELMRMLRQLSVPVTAEDTDDDDALYAHFLGAVLQATGADRGVVVLKDDTGDILRLGAIVPRDRDVSVNRVVLRAALRERKAVLCNDAVGDPRFLKTETVRKENIGSLMAYPLVRGDATCGLLYLDTQGRQGAFRRDHLLLMHFAARLLVMCLRPATRS